MNCNFSNLTRLETDFISHLDSIWYVCMYICKINYDLKTVSTIGGKMPNLFYFYYYYNLFYLLGVKTSRLFRKH